MGKFSLICKYRVLITIIVRMSFLLIAILCDNCSCNYLKLKYIFSDSSLIGFWIVYLDKESEK